jgi:hypothetical protein
MNRHDLPAWATIWGVTAAAIIMAVVAPDMRRDAFLVISASSAGAFAMLRGRD